MPSVKEARQRHLIACLEPIKPYGFSPVYARPMHSHFSQAGSSELMIGFCKRPINAQ